MRDASSSAPLRRQVSDRRGQLLGAAPVLLGLRALGIEAYWLELLWPQSDVARARAVPRTFQRYVEELGVAEWVAVVLFPDNEYDEPSRARGALRRRIRA